MQRYIPTLFVLLLCVELFAQQMVFTSSGTFTVPAGVTSITCELVGAGGNGAGNGGGGGGGGGYARGTFNVAPGVTYSIIVGAGGSELATIVGGMGILAGAGENAGTIPNPNIGGGGAGGVGMGGQLARIGGNGGGGYWTYFGGGGGGAAGPNANGTVGGNTIAYNGTNCLTPGGAAGTGGGAPAGNGGKGAGFVDNSCSAADAALAGANYGGGGGGGNGNSSPAANGGGGICIITWNGSTDIAALNADPFLLSGSSFTDRVLPRNANGTEQYTLLDAMGRTVWSGVHIEEQDLSGLRAGAYVLRVRAGEEVWTIRLTKG